MKRDINERFAGRLLNYHLYAYAYFVRNSQNGINENSKNDVRLIGYGIWGVLGGFEMVKK